jgi:hypothetical protein
MPINSLSLPIDIPWKLLATTTNMYARSINAPWPVKWRSSLAIFRYDVVLDPDDADNAEELTSFLKIVATITGYQPEGAEVDQHLLDSKLAVDFVANFEALVDAYYPAYAAIVQVAVFPAEGKWDLEQYPYLTDFEPKKREVVELASDTGESLTQSANEVHVRKGTTSTNSTEIDNLDRGFSFTKGVNIAGYGGTNQLSVEKQAGTVGGLGSGTESIVATDASREKRESLSHTTNLSQLYQILDSYHAGTNRAIFFLNARPHLIDSPFTFVNGPRRLEGIQEFFLVVRRPKAMDDFCVKAVLETAHLRESSTTVETGETTYDRSSITQQFTLTARGGSHFNAATDQARAWSIPIPGGYKLDRSRGGTIFPINFTVHPPADLQFQPPAGVDLAAISFQTAASYELDAVPLITPYDDHVDLSAHIYGWYDDGPGDHDGRLVFTVNVYIVSEQPTSTPQTSEQRSADLFLTAREVRGCLHQHLKVENEAEKQYLTYEKALDPETVRRLAASRAQGQDAAISANAVSRAVRDEVIKSFREERRYPAGAVSFFQSRFAARALYGTAPSADVNAHLARPVAEAPGLSHALQQKLADSKLTIGAVLRLPTVELAKRAALSPGEAQQVLAAAIGVRPNRAGPELASPNRVGSGNSTRPASNAEGPDDRPARRKR